MKNELQAIATILSLVNPAMCATIFMSLEDGRDRKDRIFDATRTMVIVFTVLMIAAFAGAPILRAFGVSLDAFSVAGGIVLSWIGISMLSGRGMVSNVEPSTPSATGAHSAPSLVPLILFAASPGTITGVVTISASHSGLDIPVSSIVAITVVTVLTWISLLAVARFGNAKGGPGLIRDMVTRYMGLVIVAMGIQFVLTGYTAFIGAH